MPMGKGIYDDACTAARESTKAKGCILIVLEGYAGSGMSCQSLGSFLQSVPDILREVAQQIEESGPAGMS